MSEALAAGLRGARTGWQKPPREIVWSAVLCLVIVLSYALSDIAYIRGHTALPFADESSYISKTYQIAEHHIHLWSLRRLLAVEPAVRPPLLPAIAAALVGPRGSEHEIAIVWLVVRLLGLTSGVVGIAALFRRAAIAPILLLMILGTPFFMTFRTLYMMDEPFTCFVLPTFAALLYDDQYPSWRSSGLVALMVLVLFSIKPAAPLFLLPLLAIRGLRAVWFWWKRRPPVSQLVPWAAMYAVLGVCMVALLLSPYGRASRDQYVLGMKGYWTNALPWYYLLRLSTTMVLPLGLLGLILCIPWPRRIRHKWVAIYAVAAVAWWMWFNFAISYTTDERIAVNTMPIFAAAVVILMVQQRWPLYLLGCAAAGLFLWNLLIVDHQVQAVDLGRWNYMVPIEATYCAPVADPGCHKLVKIMTGLVTERWPNPEAGLNILFMDSYFDGAAIARAQQDEAIQHRKKSGLQMLDWPIFNEKPFDFKIFLRAHWYATEQTRKTYGGDRGEMFDSLLAADALLTDSRSPIRDAFEAVKSFPITRPSQQDVEGYLYSPTSQDEVTIWHLKRDLTQEEKLSALEFMMPMFKNAGMRARMAAEIERMRNTPPSTTALSTLPATAPSN